MKFKTTIKCSGCVANVTPHLNETAGAENWEVDIQNPDKILTIKKGVELSESEIIKILERAGYKAESID